MKRITKYMISLVLLVFASISCERQKIYDPEYLTANIPIVIDWSESLVEEGDINNVSVYFYPEDGSAPTIVYSEDPYFVTALLHEGTYDIVLHNEIEGNILGVDCANSKTFDDYTMTIQREDTAKYDMFYSPEANEQLTKESEAVGAWSFKTFVVTADMIEYTRTRTFENLLTKMRSSSKALATKTDDVVDTRAYIEDLTRSLSDELRRTDPITRSITRALEDLNGVKPQPRTATYKMLLDIQNMNNIQYIEGVIDGFVDGVKVVSGEKLVPAATNYTYMQIKDYTFNEGSSTDGTMQYEFSNFGHLKADGEKYTLTINIIIHSGEKISETYDVTNQINSYATNEVVVVKVGYDYDNGTTDIVLPENRGAGFGVTGWDKAEDVEL